VLAVGIFLDRYILMLHNTSHRPLFRPRYRWLNLYIPWVLGPFFGETPETYFAHHLGMHHPENNLEDDLSSTMRYRRDHFGDFLRYFFRFFFMGIYELCGYLRRKNRGRLAWRALLGEAAFLVPVTVLLFVSWRPTLVVFVVPFLVARFGMMAGNWGQHAFIDPTRLGNSYASSITCINTPYNRRCFNDGYHIGHHVKANRHWTEMPEDFEKNRATYAREEAIVFDGLDFFQVWFLLMIGRYDKLAGRVVSLDGRRRSEEEIVALLRSRTAPIAPAPAEPAAAITA
jgi:fatty acid desaturase